MPVKWYWCAHPTLLIFRYFHFWVRFQRGLASIEIEEMPLKWIALHRWSKQVSCWHFALWTMIEWLFLLVQFVGCRLYYWQPSVGGTVSSQTLFDAFKRIEALHGTKTFRWQVTASQYRPNQRGDKKNSSPLHSVLFFFFFKNHHFCIDSKAFGGHYGEWVISMKASATASMKYLPLVVGWV